MSWKTTSAGTIVLVAAAAILYQLLYITQTQQNAIIFRGGHEYPTAPAVVPLSQDELNAFRRDGFLLKKKVIYGEELKELMEDPITRVARSRIGCFEVPFPSSRRKYGDRIRSLLSWPLSRPWSPFRPNYWKPSR